MFFCHFFSVVFRRTALSSKRTIPVHTIEPIGKLFTSHFCLNAIKTYCEIYSHTHTLSLSLSLSKGHDRKLQTMNEIYQ